MLSPAALEHKHSAEEFADLPPPLSIALDVAAPNLETLPPPLEMVLNIEPVELEKEGLNVAPLEEKKINLDSKRSTCYDGASKALAVHAALGMGICGFNAVTTLIDSAFDRYYPDPNSDSPWSLQFLLVLSIGVMGGLILTALTYKGIQHPSLKKEKLKLNALVSEAEDIAQQSHYLVNETIKKRENIKKILAGTQKRQNYLNKIFDIHHEMKLAAGSMTKASAKKIWVEEKKNNNCSFKKVGNLCLHLLAGAVRTATHLIAIESVVANIDKLHNYNIPVTDAELWLICGSLVLIFDG
jgi:hypothetical protein